MRKIIGYQNPHLGYICPHRINQIYMLTEQNVNGIDHIKSCIVIIKLINNFIVKTDNTYINRENELNKNSVPHKNCEL